MHNQYLQVYADRCPKSLVFGENRAKTWKKIVLAFPPEGNPFSVKKHSTMPVPITVVIYFRTRPNPCPLPSQPTNPDNAQPEVVQEGWAAGTSGRPSGPHAARRTRRGSRRWGVADSSWQGVWGGTTGGLPRTRRVGTDHAIAYRPLPLGVTFYFRKPVTRPETNPLP